MTEEESRGRRLPRRLAAWALGGLLAAIHVGHALDRSDPIGRAVEPAFDPDRILPALYATGEECAELYGDQVAPLDTCLRPEVEIGGVRTNRHGTFGADFEVPRPADVLRVAALGGSATAGFRSPDLSFAWPELLERRLADRHAPGELRVEVRNYGLVGADARTVAARMEHDVARHDVQIAIAYVGWNDVEACHFLGPGPEAFLAEALHDAPPRDRWRAHPSLASHREIWSARLAQRRAQVEAYAQREGLPMETRSQREHANELYLDWWRRDLRRADPDRLPLRSTAELDPRGLLASLPVESMRGGEIDRHLSAFVDSARRHDVEAILLTVNGRVGCAEAISMVDLECPDYAVSGPERAAFVVHALPRLVRAIGEREGVEVIDLAARWEARDKCTDFMDLEHPSFEGHLRIASWVEPSIRARLGGTPPAPSAASEAVDP